MNQGISIFWQDITPLTISKRDEYGWEEFSLKNEIAHTILPKYKVHLLKTEKIYYPRKVKDPKVSGDMVLK